MRRVLYAPPTPVIRNQTSGILTPAAAAGTPGSPRTITASGHGYSIAHQIAVTFNGAFNAETVTALVTLTFTDGTTTAPFGLAASAPGTSGVSSNDIAYLMPDKCLIASVTATVQSTRDTSAVTATMRVTATQV
ncbi:hypothetical protein GCM10010174_61720 [Kutzneria viridogrisea]|uniref:Uncharacterized protein n=1 Tax=Kutzneria viridogrisea TaxID=47990 RepID=A0ABR6BH51_9PSEU|nr:hypothetical protein [Kutzneria viridogrisea]